MVGVTTSKRCDNCRKRKKRCDERRPSCSECLRSGWSCPGYKTRWKFVDEASGLAKHYARRKYTYDSPGPTAEAYPMYDTAEDARMNGMMMLWKNLQSVPRNPTLNHLGSALVFCLDNKVTSTLIPLRLVGSFLEFIPAHLGRNAALDEAVSCVCAIYHTNLSTPYDVHTEIRRSYVRALSSLRTCLNDSYLWMESETLCASILLQLCELAISVERGEWSQLSRGTALLLQSRGVHRYNSAFDHALLESQLSYVISQSMKFREPCFLQSPEWKALLSQTSALPYHLSQTRSLTLRSHMCAMLIDAPGLIARCSALNNEQGRISARKERLDILVREISTIIGNIKQWLTVEAEPFFMSYITPEDNNQRWIKYPDVVAGVLDCVTHSSLLILDKFLRYLCHEREISAFPQPQLSEISHVTLYNQEMIELLTSRATIAFRFVQSQSTLAAKPLNFGLRQIDSSGPVM